MKILFNKNNPLYLLTDSKIAGFSNIEIARRAVSAGVSVIQLRAKEQTKRKLFYDAVAIRKITGEGRAVFIVNDHIDIAIAADADGVHLGQDDMPLEEARKIMGKNKIIGISTHTLKQALGAQAGGADYIGFGPMFLTKTKDAGRPRGTALLREIRRNISIPIVAIGGISWENISEVIASGVDSAAIASGILAGGIGRNVKRYMSAIR